MTSFDSSPTLTVWRTLLALAVVFVMLATTGWTAVHHQRTAGPRQAALTAWGKGSLAGHPLPPTSASPYRLARFFAGLTAAERSRLADRYPLVVGNLNGAPVTLRYQANQDALRQARTSERQRLTDPSLSELGHQDARRTYDRYTALLQPGRQILAFDPTGTGRVAEVIGDLPRARHISIVVPGVDTNLLTFQKSKNPYTAPVGMATSLYAAEHSAAPGSRTAVIAWADYTTPVGLGVDAAIGRLAAEGSLRLHALVDALPGDAPVALFCHSYGSVLCGVAAHDLPPRVTDIAVAGSPGMRVENAGQLDTDARVWAMRDSDDWIQDVPHLDVGGLGHGADPVAPQFGARIVSAGQAHGHTGYFEPGTESLRNFAAVGTGEFDAVSCANGSDTCHS
ncbi:alpha/beta hydrolase family protein [Streptomyces sp. NBC_01267]|uniref:alpha/beta hydrolase n=1 Tax=unclassified Streptomyces TaxID=2593676 RepID=UPI002E34638B|nr:alpha/beta hydrolase [Streptomyces sp. NBC_01267]WSV56638.1 alpha/beta hydrolase family protein [Streptomyces sp. NBC_01014]